MGQADRRQRERRETRHVWIRPRHFHDHPKQGLVVGWRRRREGWSAWCVWVERGPDGGDQLVQRWVAARNLIPIITDPEVVIPPLVNPGGVSRLGDYPPHGTLG